MESMRPIGTVQLRVLAAIQKNPDNAYGLAILSGLEAGEAIGGNDSGIYNALEKLYKRGMLTKTHSNKTGEVGRPRVYYKITPKGEAALEEMRAVIGVDDTKTKKINESLNNEIDDLLDAAWRLGTPQLKDWIVKKYPSFGSLR